MAHPLADVCQEQVVKDNGPLRSRKIMSLERDTVISSEEFEASPKPIGSALSITPQLSGYSIMRQASLRPKVRTSYHRNIVTTEMMWIGFGASMTAHLCCHPSPSGSIGRWNAQRWLPSCREGKPGPVRHFKPGQAGTSRPGTCLVRDVCIDSIVCRRAAATNQLHDSRPTLTKAQQPGDRRHQREGGGSSQECASQPTCSRRGRGVDCPIMMCCTAPPACPILVSVTLML